MKTRIYTLFFFLTCASVFNANSQIDMLSTGNTNEQKLAFIKTFKSTYLNNKVYLHITINGNTENKILLVERSLDATHFEVIGRIAITATNTQFDLAYYFTDESPVVANLYYRLSDFNDEKAYSEIINVIPIEENKTQPFTKSTALSLIKE